MDTSRRKLLKNLALLLAAMPLRQLLALEQASSNHTADPVGNFRYIYSRKELRTAFLDFYTNVFHLYPPQKLHGVVQEISLTHASDEAVYRELQSRLDEITPFLASVRYALPALAKQKAEMTRQSLQLIDKERPYEGYLEIGTTGRYLSDLEEHLDIQGERFLLHTRQAGYGPEDIIERGQLSPIGSFIQMGDYSSDFRTAITENSLDLVTVYIGFHHCPLHQREAFISSVRDVLKPGGKLILRDHDAHNEDMLRIAALAHDTFNAGTQQSWEANHGELRNFYSNRYIIDYLGRLGLKHDGRVLFQQGDPTLNGLMAFTKA